MKKILSVAIVAAAFATSFSAHAAGAYVSVDAGQANWSGDLATGWDSTTSNAFQIAAGYNFTPTWGVELGYADLGKLDANVIVSGVSVHPEIKTSAYYLAATGNFPINDKFSFFGKLGVASNKTEASGSVGNTSVGLGSTSTTTGMIAIGGAYNFTKNFGATLAYTYFGNNDYDLSGTTTKGTVGAWTVGLKYNF